GLALPVAEQPVVAGFDVGGAPRDPRAERGVPGDALGAEPGQLRDRGRGVAEDAQAAVWHAGVVHRPLAEANVAKPDLDHLASGRIERLDRALGALDMGGGRLP